MSQSHQGFGRRPGVLWALVVCAPLVATQEPAAAPMEGALGFPRPVSLLSDDVLALATGDVDGDGHVDVVALTGFDGGRELQLLRGRGTGWFERFACSSAPTDSEHLVLSDVDGDDDLDAVCLTEQLLHVVPFERGSGFGTPVLLGVVSAAARDVAAADLTEDGREELVVLDAGTSAAQVVAVDGGRLQPVARLETGPGPARVELVDVDADGRLDVVVAAATRLTAHPSLGGGRFAPAVISPVAGAEPPATLAVGDLDSDGSPDLVAGRYRYLGAGDGGFGQPLQLELGGEVRALQLVDASDDGLPDVVAAGEDGLHVAVNDGTGLAFEARILTDFLRPGHLARGDLNGDGVDDLLAAEGATIAPLVKAAQGFHALTKGAASTLLLMDEAYGDLDGDGVLDRVRFDWGGLHVEAGQGEGGFAPAHTSSPLIIVVDETSSHVRLGDLDGDGRLDVVASARNSWEVSGCFTQPDGTLGGCWDHALTAPFRAHAADLVDLDQDGVDELLVFERILSAPDRRLTVLRSQGGGAPEPQQTLTLPEVPTAWASGDLDGDGDVDLVVDFDGVPGRVHVFEGLGGGLLAPGENLAGVSGSGVTDLALADLDRDGLLDLVIAAASGLHVHRGAGGGAFGPLEWVPVSQLVSQVRADDLDADGDADLALVGAHVAVLWNETAVSGPLDLVESIHLGPEDVERLTSADLDGDGFPELVLLDIEEDWEFGGLDTRTVLPGGLVPGWTDLGGATPPPGGGAALAGSGALFPGSSTTLSVTGGRARSPVLLLASLGAAPQPALGGVHHPDRSATSLLLTADAEGALSLAVGWPAAFMSGAAVYVQALVETAPAGVVLSNALRGETP